MALVDRKIPIITGVNDVPSTVGQPNYPNDSLLCANINALIDTELTDIDSRLTTNTTAIMTLQSAIPNSDSVISVPISASNILGVDADIAHYKWMTASNYIGTQFEYESPLGWSSITVFGEQYDLSSIDGVQQTLPNNTDFTFTATRSGTNLEFLQIDYELFISDDKFMILPIYFEIEANTPSGGSETRKVIHNYLNTARIENNMYGWENTSSPTGGY